MSRSPEWPCGDVEGGRRVWFWDFLKVRKKYWLAPLIITIVLMGVLIVFTQGSVVAPFIYSIF